MGGFMKTNPDLIRVMMQDLGVMTQEEHDAERLELFGEAPPKAKALKREVVLQLERPYEMEPEIHLKVRAG